MEIDGTRSRVTYRRRKVTKWDSRGFRRFCNGEKSVDDSNLIFLMKLNLCRCLELEIKEVTVYAFSIENFKRSQDEVDTLMSLAREKFAKLMEEKEKLSEKGIRIRVIGNVKLLPVDLQKSIADAMLLTKDNDKSTLNVAFAYTSRDEITHSVATIMKGVEDEELNEADLNHSLIDECLYTNKCRDIDLLVRTSGEMRFSDFLLWQVTIVQNKTDGSA